jgi:hypothetical protein
MAPLPSLLSQALLSSQTLCSGIGPDKHLLLLDLSKMLNFLLLLLRLGRREVYVSASSRVEEVKKWVVCLSAIALYFVRDERAKFLHLLPERDPLMRCDRKA